VRPGANVAEIVAIRGPRWRIPDLWKRVWTDKNHANRGQGSYLTPFLFTSSLENRGMEFLSRNR